LSYSYASAKKLRKRTKVERLQAENTFFSNAGRLLLTALQQSTAVCNHFGEESRWLSTEDDQQHVDYIYTGERNPVELVKEAQASINKMLEPLVPFLRTVADIDAKLSGDQSSGNAGKKLENASETPASEGEHSAEAGVAAA
jgi:hypothetical protein